MSVDHCIITKYTLSEREKDSKKLFFSKKNKSEIIQKIHNRTSKTNPPPTENEEMINKLVERNMEELKTYESNFRSKSRGTDNNQSEIPLNLIYSQNKILERNVDILHETQRSLHDVLIYNFRKDKEKTEKNQISLKNEKLIFDLISPLVSKIDELKNSLKEIQNSHPSGKNETNEKIKDFETKQSKFKENSQKFEKSLEEIEKNKQVNKDNQILKAIDDLKKSVLQINSEMNKMENEFSLNLRRMMEENEKSKFKNLLSGVNSSVNNTVNKLNSINTSKNGNKANCNSMDYVDYHKELLDINQRKEEIFYEFKSKKIEMTNLNKMMTSKEKIEFSYKLDFELENSNGISDKSTKIMHSRSNYYSEKESDSEKSGKNIFLNNMNHSANTTNKMRSLQSKNLINKSNPSRNSSSLLDNANVNLTSKSKEKSKKIESEQQILIQDYYKNSESLNTQELIENSPKNIMDRMKECKEKMKNYKIQTDDSDSKFALSINVNNSTKHNTTENTSEPSSAKYLKSSSVLKNFNNKLDIIEEKQSAKPELDVFKVLLKKIEDEIQTKGYTDSQIRKEIKIVPSDMKKNDAVQDLILKLCVEKMILEKNNSLQEKSIKNDDASSFVEKPKPYPENMFPFSTDGIEIKHIIENLLIENIRNIIRMKNKNHQKEEKIENINTSNRCSLEKLKDENLKREDASVIENYLKDITTRFESIEKQIKEKEKDKGNDELKNLNVEDMINKITEKIKGSMHININLGDPYERKTYLDRNALHTDHQSLQIEAIKKIESEDSLVDNASVKAESTYSHPFANTKRIDENEIEREIPLPYMFNLNEYEISYTTELEMSVTDRPYPSVNNNRQLQSEIRDESVSEGQIISSRTDQDTNRSITNVTYNNYPDHIKEIFNSNENKNKRSEEAQTPSSNQNEKSQTNYLEENEEETSSIDINVNKYLLNINDNEELKKYNLFNSEEFNRFQNNFKPQNRMENTQMTQRFSETGMNTVGCNSFRFINFNNNSADKQAQEINFSKSYNPNILSFGNFVSHRSDDISNLNSKSAKFIKISNEEIEDLIQRQNAVNHRLKNIARNVDHNNNTIFEKNNSEGTTLIHKVDESLISQSDRKYQDDAYNYKTDESSFDEKSYRNHSEYFN